VLLLLLQAGAAAVYGIECSSIAVQAKQIVTDNHLSGKVHIIHGKVEEITLPVEKVSLPLFGWCCEGCGGCGRDGRGGEREGGGE